jgi:Ala-tRNA(Pro) deacylase
MEASMSIAMTVDKYLRQLQVPYDILPHYRTGSSLETARVAHISAHQLAKAVLLEDDAGYLMAVLPASEHVHLGMLREQLGRAVGLATEREVMEVFKDCDMGAIPPLGPAYGVPMIVDEELTREPELYFEGGSHVDLVHMDSTQYMKLCEGAGRAHFCGPQH